MPAARTEREGGVAGRAACMMDRSRVARAVTASPPDEVSGVDRRLSMVVAGVLAIGCSAPGGGPTPSGLSGTAEAFFRGVYGCAPEGLVEISNPGVALSYPIFERLYDTSVIRGLESVTDFSASFCRRWASPTISIDQTIDDGERVVLVWSFSAIDQLAQDSAQTRQSWGGISVFDFDDSGRVLEEFGEESSPGPTARLANPPGL